MPRSHQPHFKCSVAHVAHGYSNGQHRKRIFPSSQKGLLVGTSGNLNSIMTKHETKWAIKVWVAFHQREKSNWRVQKSSFWWQSEKFNLDLRANREPSHVPKQGRFVIK